FTDAEAGVVAIVTDASSADVIDAIGNFFAVSDFAGEEQVALPAARKCDHETRLGSHTRGRDDSDPLDAEIAQPHIDRFFCAGLADQPNRQLRRDSDARCGALLTAATRIAS